MSINQQEKTKNNPQLCSVLTDPAELSIAEYLHYFTAGQQWAAPGGTQGPLVPVQPLYLSQFKWAWKKTKSSFKTAWRNVYLPQQRWSDGLALSINALNEPHGRCCTERRQHENRLSSPENNAGWRECVIKAFCGGRLLKVVVGDLSSAIQTHCFIITYGGAWCIWEWRACWGKLQRGTFVLLL